MHDPSVLTLTLALTFALRLTLAAAAGVVLGGLFFGGLWITTQQALWSRRPALLFVGSQLLRTGMALAGFYLVGRTDWRLLPVCLLGFVVARFIVLHMTRLPAGADQSREASRAP